jgi:hypothetical protein
MQCSYSIHIGSEYWYCWYVTLMEGGCPGTCQHTTFLFEELLSLMLSCPVRCSSAITVVTDPVRLPGSLTSVFPAEGMGETVQG